CWQKTPVFRPNVAKDRANPKPCQRKKATRPTGAAHPIPARANSKLSRGAVGTLPAASSNLQARHRLANSARKRYFLILPLQISWKIQVDKRALRSLLSVYYQDHVIIPSGKRIFGSHRQTQSGLGRRIRKRQRVERLDHCPISIKCQDHIVRGAA